MGMMALPSRRDEAWRWTDLRAAYADGQAPAMAHEGDVIERLARAAGQHGALTIAARAHEVQVIRLQEPGAVSTDVVVEPGASFDRVVIQDHPGIVLTLARVRVLAGGRFRQFTFAEGGRLVRLETQVSVEGAGAEVSLNGVYLAGAGRHADLTSVVAHKVGGSQTRQLVKGAARRGGRGVFQGKILVAREAQKTDAQQHHHALLLEEGAEVYAKPELEIYADDVACAHGNTAGSLDEQALFYMRSRGIGLEDARALLIQAFLQEAVPAWLNGALLAEVEGRLGRWLAGFQHDPSQTGTVENAQNQDSRPLSDEKPDATYPESGLGASS